ncbi:hypothetical protein FACS1894201_09280 [Bacteroidia bacterium]|nr:hypothetical protein FACS1894201_09280 [Bacteroidia bacterium]
MYIARLFMAKYCAPSDATTYERTVISIMTPKGLAAAVLASMPEAFGIPEGTLIKNVVYATIFFSILTTSILIICENKIPGLKHRYSRFFK